MGDKNSVDVNACSKNMQFKFLPTVIARLIYHLGSLL